ncbi:MAG: hypothetical protein U1D30_14030 [Planctomycetota bacterium]
MIDLSIADGGQTRKDGDLFRQGIDVRLNGSGVDVGINAEIAELASFPAERNVQIEAEGDIATPKLGRSAFNGR